jgi:quinolinate synthase
MAMNGLVNLAEVLEHGQNEIFVDPAIGARARLPIDRMLAFAAERKKRVQASGDLQRDQPLFAKIGAA